MNKCDALISQSTIIEELAVRLNRFSNTFGESEFAVCCDSGINTTNAVTTGVNRLKGQELQSVGCDHRLALLLLFSSFKCSLQRPQVTYDWGGTKT